MTAAVRETVTVEGLPAASPSPPARHGWPTAATAPCRGSTRTRTPSCRHVPVGNAPLTGVTAGAGAIWVANSGDQTIYLNDPRSGGRGGDDRRARRADRDRRRRRRGLDHQLEQPHRLPARPPIGDTWCRETPVGGWLTWIAVGHGAVWVANSLDGTVSRIAPSSGIAALTIPVGNGPYAIAVGRDGVWVSRAVRRCGRSHRPGYEPRRRTDPGWESPGLALLSSAGARGRGPVRRAPRIAEGRCACSVDRRRSTSWTLPSPTCTGSFPFVAIDRRRPHRRAAGRRARRHVPLPLLGGHAAQGHRTAGRTYRFALRTGIHYSTGGAVRARDVRPSFERL